ncbi:MAG: hypothetical protein E6R04_06320 [Spirochaetes bacterium]|nr:MAG: hypothetical protein E6R04_06320 [Spirochaetota bacterium]
MTDAAPAAGGQAPAPNAQGQAQSPATKAWYEGHNFAPEDIGYIQNKGWDDPVKPIQAYKNLEKLQGVPAEYMIKIPKSLDDPAALAPIYDRLGRPASPDKYEVKIEGFEVDPKRMEIVRNAAHKAGLNPAQLQALAAADAQYMGEVMKAHEAEKAQRMEVELGALQREWGTHFEERAELGRRFVRNSLPSGIDKEATLSAIEEAIGTALTLKLFANAGEKTVREHNIPDSSGDRPFGYTREQAAADRKSLMDELKADPSRLANYNKGVGPDIDKMARLNKILSGA